MGRRTGLIAYRRPTRADPQVALIAYQGYLGLDTGRPQSVYAIDQEQIARGALNEVGSANLALGETLTLPDGTAVSQTLGIASIGGVTLDNEENYLIKKLLGGGLGIVSIENQARI